jgi:hypothetical protein
MYYGVSHVDENGWLKFFEDAYKHNRKELNTYERHVLLSLNPQSDNPPKRLSEQQFDHLMGISEIVMRYFWNMVSKGDTFLTKDIIREKIGLSVEQSTKLNDGPFHDLWNTYWTFRIALDEYGLGNVERCKYNYFQILRNVETKVASIFIPTPGPVKSNLDYKVTQEKILKEYAPSINIERFLAESPAVRRQHTQGCLSAVIMSILVTILIVLSYSFVMK